MLAILSSRTDVRETAILGMEAPSQLPGKLNIGLRSHSDVIEGCVPIWSDVRAEPFCHG